MPRRTCLGAPLVHERRSSLLPQGPPRQARARAARHVRGAGRQVGVIRSAERDPALDGYRVAGQAVRRAGRRTCWRVLGQRGRGSSANGHGIPSTRARSGGACVPARPDRERRESAVGHRRGRGVDPPRVSATAMPIFLRNWPYAHGSLRPARLARSRQGGRRVAPAPAHGTRGAGLNGRRAPRRVCAARVIRKLRPRSRAFSPATPPQRAMAAGAALSPSRMALYRDPDARCAIIRACPRIYELTLAAPPTPDHALLPDALDHAAAGVLRARSSACKTPAPRDRRAQRPGSQHLLDGLR